ncbi:MAG: VOC family protein [Proteobacteria bacterium]|nr:VOC family protein [Pseudomonadota bacterium]
MISGICGINHIALSVDDLAKAEAFYVDAIGFDLVERYAFEPDALTDRVSGLENCSAQALLIAAGNIYLEIFEFTSPIPAAVDGDRPVCDFGYTHIALDVDPESVDTVYRELEQAGVRWHHPPTGDMGDGLVMTYGRDPFGNVIELQALDPSGTVHCQRLPHWRPVTGQGT